jgi:hypothetical protein
MLLAALQPRALARRQLASRHTLLNTRFLIGLTLIDDWRWLRKRGQCGSGQKGGNKQIRIHCSVS